MLILDLDNKRVNSDPRLDLDVVVIKGASPSLINRLSRLALQTPATNPRKVALGGVTRPAVPYREKISSTLPSSVFAEGNGSFNELFARLGALITPEVLAASKCRPTCCSTEKVLSKGNKNRSKIQKDIADALIGNVRFVENLRVAIQNSNVLNRSANLPTTANTKAAIALYAYYSDDKSFSSTVGSATIAKSATASPDTIARLGSEFSILRKTGNSSATRYFVSSQFGTLLINKLQAATFNSLRNEVDILQEQLDGLGSLK